MEVGPTKGLVFRLSSPSAISGKCNIEVDNEMFHTIMLHDDVEEL